MTVRSAARGHCGLEVTRSLLAREHVAVGSAPKRRNNDRNSGGSDELVSTRVGRSCRRGSKSSQIDCAAKGCAVAVLPAFLVTWMVLVSVTMRRDPCAGSSTIGGPRDRPGHTRLARFRRGRDRRDQHDQDSRHCRPPPRAAEGTPPGSYSERYSPDTPCKGRSLEICRTICGPHKASASSLMFGQRRLHTYLYLNDNKAAAR